MRVFSKYVRIDHQLSQKHTYIELTTTETILLQAVLLEAGPNPKDLTVEQEVVCSTLWGMLKKETGI